LVIPRRTTFGDLDADVERSITAHEDACRHAGRKVRVGLDVESVERLEPGVGRLEVLTRRPHGDEEGPRAEGPARVALDDIGQALDLLEGEARG
jgi:hypothetical protein